MKNQTFILTTRATAEQYNRTKLKIHVLMKLTICTTISNGDISEFGFLSTINVYLSKMQ